MRDPLSENFPDLRLVNHLLTQFRNSLLLAFGGAVMLKYELLSILRSEPGGAAGLSVAWTKLNLKLGRALSQADLQAAITELEAEKAIKQIEGSGETRLAIRGAKPLPPPPDAAENETAAPPRDPREIPEDALMSPVEAWIRHIHAPGYSLKDEGKPTFVVSDTSRGGTATGLWTRPDITVASVRRYRYTNLRRIELTGYELKKAGGASITAVHEALAHKRWVHSAYLFVFTPTGPLAPEIRIADIKAECARHGVGLITFANPNDQGTFEVHLQAQADDVDPARVDEFISDRMQDSEADIRRLLEV
jgi:hypothetical protein